MFLFKKVRYVCCFVVGGGCFLEASSVIRRPIDLMSPMSRMGSVFRSPFNGLITVQPVISPLYNSYRYCSHFSYGDEKKIPIDTKNFSKVIRTPARIIPVGNGNVDSRSQQTAERFHVEEKSALITNAITDSFLQSQDVYDAIDRSYDNFVHHIITFTNISDEYADAVKALVELYGAMINRPKEGVTRVLNGLTHTRLSHIYCEVVQHVQSKNSTLATYCHMYETLFKLFNGSPFDVMAQVAAKMPKKKLDIQLNKTMSIQEFCVLVAEGANPFYPIHPVEVKALVELYEAMSNRPKEGVTRVLTGLTRTRLSHIYCEVVQHVESKNSNLKAYCSIYARVSEALNGTAMSTLYNVINSKSKNADSQPLQDNFTQNVLYSFDNSTQPVYDRVAEQPKTIRTPARVMPVSNKNVAIESTQATERFHIDAKPTLTTDAITDSLMQSQDIHNGLDHALDHFVHRVVTDTGISDEYSQSIKALIQLYGAMINRPNNAITKVLTGRTQDNGASYREALSYISAQGSTIEDYRTMYESLCNVFKDSPFNVMVKIAYQVRNKKTNVSFDAKMGLQEFCVLVAEGAHPFYPIHPVEVRALIDLYAAMTKRPRNSIAKVLSGVTRDNSETHGEVLSYLQSRGSNLQTYRSIYMRVCEALNKKAIKMLYFMVDRQQKNPDSQPLQDNFTQNVLYSVDKNTQPVYDRAVEQPKMARAPVRVMPVANRNVDIESQQTTERFHMDENSVGTTNTKITSLLKSQDVQDALDRAINHFVNHIVTDTNISDVHSQKIKALIKLYSAVNSRPRDGITKVLNRSTNTPKSAIYGEVLAYINTQHSTLEDYRTMYESLVDVFEDSPLIAMIKVADKIKKKDRWKTYIKSEEPIDIQEYCMVIADGSDPFYYVHPVEVEALIELYGAIINRPRDGITKVLNRSTNTPKSAIYGEILTYINAQGLDLETYRSIYTRVEASLNSTAMNMVYYVIDHQKKNPDSQLLQKNVKKTIVPQKQIDQMEQKDNTVLSPKISNMVYAYKSNVEVSDDHSLQDNILQTKDGRYSISTREQKILNRVYDLLP